MAELVTTGRVSEVKAYLHRERRLKWLLGISVPKNGKKEQPFHIVLIHNLLQAYASIFNFLQHYATKSSKSSTFVPLILSVGEAFYCNFMRPAECKEMGIVAASKPNCKGLH